MTILFSSCTITTEDMITMTAHNKNVDKSDVKITSVQANDRFVGATWMASVHDKSVMCMYMIDPIFRYAITDKCS